MDRTTMDRTTIREGIRNYNRHIEEAGYVHDLLGTAGTAELPRVACRMVRGGRPDDAGAAMLLALDVGRHYFMPDEVTGVFRQAILVSGFLDVLGDTLRSGVYANRANAANTLGRLGLPEAVPMVTGVVDHYFGHDPLLLPGLLWELSWLTRRHDWRYVERAASHEHYLFRWQTAEFLFERVGNPAEEDYDTRKRMVWALSEDVSPPVRAEARYCRERMTLREAGPQLDRAESRRRHRAIRRQFEPALTFGSLGVRYWAGHDGLDYTMAELDSFVRGMTAAGG